MTGAWGEGSDSKESRILMAPRATELLSGGVEVSAITIN
jgi:hypothetical protein